MSDAPQPTSGSLSAKIIRACKVHNNKCKLDCPKRETEDLGEIATFQSPLPDPTGTHPPERSFLRWPPWSRTPEKQ